MNLLQRLWSRTKPTAAKPAGGRVVAKHATDLAAPEPTYTPKLVAEIESDPQFLLGKLVVTAMIQATEYSVEVEGGDERAQVLADNLKEQFEKALPAALNSFGYGRQAFERWYKYDPSTRLNLLGGMDAIEFENSKMILEECGGFGGIEFHVEGEPVEVIPKSAAWWCALDATSKHPHGRSRYRGAPWKVFCSRQQLDENEKTYQKKFALGNGIAKAPRSYDMPTLQMQSHDGQTHPHGNPSDPLADTAAALMALESGGSAVLPSGQYPPEQGGGEMFSWIPPSTPPSAAPLENRRSLLDAYALRSIGVPERAVTQDAQTGSYSMAEVHWKVLGSTCEGVISQIVSSFQDQVVGPTVCLNYGPEGRPKLTLKFEPIADPTRGLIIELVKAIVGQPTPSPLVTNGVIDLGKMLENAGVPAGDDIEEKLSLIAEKFNVPTPTPQQQFGLSKNSTPSVPDWEAISKQADAEAATLFENIFKQALDNPLSIDRRLLQRGSDGIPPPAVPGAGGGTDRGGDAAV